MLTTNEIRELLIEWANQYCGQEFKEPLPSGFKLFIEKGVEYIETISGAQSESLGDYHITFTTDFPPAILRLLNPYKRLKVPR